MSANPHFEQSLAALNLASEAIVTQDAALVAIQTQATLALAYEQRTANLIGVFRNLATHELDTYLGRTVNGEKLAAQIKERLDLA